MKNFVFVAAVGMILSANSQSIEAQVVPLVASGTGATYAPYLLETIGPGKATHMGKIVGSGIATPGVEVGPGLYTWSADDYVLEAANGDKLFMSGGGLVQFVPISLEDNLFYAVWLGEFTVTGGTGQFEPAGPADEPIQVEAINDPFTFPASPVDIWTYDWSLSGEIDLGKEQ